MVMTPCVARLKAEQEREALESKQRDVDRAREEQRLKQEKREREIEERDRKKEKDERGPDDRRGDIRGPPREESSWRRKSPDPEDIKYLPKRGEEPRRAYKPPSMRSADTGGGDWRREDRYNIHYVMCHSAVALPMPYLIITLFYSFNIYALNLYFLLSGEIGTWTGGDHQGGVMTMMVQEDVIHTIARGVDEEVEISMILEAEMIIVEEETLEESEEVTMIEDPPEVIKMKSRGGSQGMMTGEQPLEKSPGVGTMDHLGGMRGHVGVVMMDLLAGMKDRGGVVMMIGEGMIAGA